MIRTGSFFYCGKIPVDFTNNLQGYSAGIK